MNKEIWIKGKLSTACFFIRRGGVTIYYDKIEVTPCQLILREKENINAILNKFNVIIKESD